jgi:hypothetical protein
LFSTGGGDSNKVNLFMVGYLTLAMEDLTKIRLGVICLLIITYLVALVGYTSNDDSLMHLGVMSLFVAILISAGFVGYTKNREPEPHSNA